MMTIEQNEIAMFEKELENELKDPKIYNELFGDDELQSKKMYLIERGDKVINIKKKTKCFITFDLYNATYDNNNNIYNLSPQYHNIRCKLFYNENNEIFIKLDSGIYYDELILKNCYEIFKYKYIM